ncbi:hypothetical protein WCD74_25095 [Actinomycetospora sp. OC33-EN08]|uniref:Uncharacterized protein n=1 Tax=Actinomycetospora aurantiaca TaxID=3129233 RepID=A0ABU8MWN6_9PSEU
MQVEDEQHRRSRYPGRGDALQTLTAAGTPLLAGFCITLIGVVAQAPDRFAAASATILLLTVAAIAFAVSIHCYYWTRVHQVDVGDAAAPGAVPSSPVLDHMREQFAHLAWARRLHVFFQTGIFMLFVGLGTAVWPVPDEPDPGPRIAAVACCVAMVVLVLFWTFGFFYLRLIAAADRGSRAAQVVLWWFRPGARAYERYLAESHRVAETARSPGSTVPSAGD